MFQFPNAVAVELSVAVAVTVVVGGNRDRYRFGLLPGVLPQLTAFSCYLTHFLKSSFHFPLHLQTGGMVQSGS